MNRSIICNLVNRKTSHCLSFIRHNATAAKSFSTEKYCIEHVRKYDYENYLATLLIGNRRVRRCAFAVRAFNIEIAQVRELTSNEQIAQMRFTFWKNILDDMYTGRNSAAHYANNPVSAELYNVTENITLLTKRHLKRLIDVRAASSQASNCPFNTINELMDYAEGSTAPVYLFIIESFMAEQYPQNDKEARTVQVKLDHIAKHIGTAQGLLNFTRAIPHNSRRNRCYVPNDLLRYLGATHEDIIRGRGDKDVVINTIYEIVARANQHLEKAAEILQEKDVRSARLLFLPTVAMDRYLTKLQYTNFNVFDKVINKRDGLLPLMMYIRSLKIKMT